MNSTGMFVSALCGAAVTAAIVCTFMIPKAEDDSLQGDIASQLASIHKRLDRMNESLAQLKGSVVTDKELRERTSGLVDQSALAELEKRIDELKLTAAGSPSPSLSKDSPVKDEIANLLDERLKIAKAKELALARKKKEEGLKSWIQGSTKKYAAGLGKKLALSRDQTDKMARVLEENGLANVSNFGALKDESVSVEDRLQAVRNIQAGEKNLEDEARNILSTSQFEQFQQIRSEDPKSPTRWIGEVAEQLRSSGAGNGK